jgi:hypothetical protein
LHRTPGARPLRILVSCLQSLVHHNIPRCDHWRTYFVRGLEEAGQDVLEVPGVDWAEGLVHGPGPALRAWRCRIWESVVAYVSAQRAPIDLFLCYLYPQQIDTAAVQELQRVGIPCVQFFCDNVRQFHRVPGEYRPFALHWVPEPEALPMYRDAGLPHLHAPMPCWVPPSLRHVPSVETAPPTFIGSPDILRRDLLGRALQGGAQFVVRGHGWSKEEGHAPRRRSLRKIVINQWALARKHGISAVVHRIEDRLHPLHPPPIPEGVIGEEPFDEAEYARITREATVTIGVSRVPTAHARNRKPLAYSRLRDLEAPMLGACYLTEWTLGVESLFELGTDIETYRTADELRDKLAELTRSPTRRSALRQSAQRRALAEHSVGRSLERIAARLGLR